VTTPRCGLINRPSSVIESEAPHYQWLGDDITKHSHGDDTDVKVLMGGILQAFAGMTVDDYGADAHSYVHEGQHPTLGRSFRDCGYRPMIELLE
jgi:hypothetical protein